MERVVMEAHHFVHHLFRCVDCIQRIFVVAGMSFLSAFEVGWTINVRDESRLRWMPSQLFSCLSTRSWNIHRSKVSAASFWKKEAGRKTVNRVSNALRDSST